MALARRLEKGKSMVVVQMGSLEAVGKPRRQPWRLAESLSTQLPAFQLVSIVWQLTCYR